MGKPLAKFRLLPSVSRAEDILKKEFSGGTSCKIPAVPSSWWNQPSYSFIYQPSAKSWKNISLYHELSWLVLDWEFLFVASSFLFHCWLGIAPVEGLHLWLLGALVYLILFVLDTVENSWGVDWIYRDLPRKALFWFDLCGWLLTILGYFLHLRLEVFIQD